MRKRTGQIEIADKPKFDEMTEIRKHSFLLGKYGLK